VNKAELPKLGEGRVLLTPGAEQQLLYSTATNVTQDFLGKRLALWSNLNLLERAPKVNGSSTLQLREQMEVQSLIYGKSNLFHRGLIEMLGVTLYSLPDNPAEWRVATNACPLVSCGQAPAFANAALAGTDFDPHARVFLRPEARSLVTVTNRGLAQILGAKISAHTIEAQVEAQGATLVVVAQSHHPAWRAFVDGREVPLLRANHAFQALEMPAGRHTLRLAYQDRKFLAGGLISLLTLGGSGWYWLRRRTTDAGVPLVLPGEGARKAA
jgi:hypothetical protein